MEELQRRSGFNDVEMRHVHFEDAEVIRLAMNAAMANRTECERVERHHSECGDFNVWVDHLAS
jgi:hypothetical protein